MDQVARRQLKHLLVRRNQPLEPSGILFLLIFKPGTVQLGRRLLQQLPITPPQALPVVTILAQVVTIGMVRPVLRLRIILFALPSQPIQFGTPFLLIFKLGTVQLGYRLILRLLIMQLLALPAVVIDALPIMRGMVRLVLAV